MTDTTRSEASELAEMLENVLHSGGALSEGDLSKEILAFLRSQSASVQAEPTEAQVEAALIAHKARKADFVMLEVSQSTVDKAAMSSALKAAAIPAPGQVSDDAADEIVTRLYRRFKDWSKRGFGPEDVTWCEVKADVIALCQAARVPAPVADVPITHEQLCKLACEWSYSIDEAWDTACQAFEAVGLTLVAAPRATGETGNG